MRKAINQRGFTLPEVMTAMFIMTMIVLATGAMVVSTMRCYDGEIAKTDTDSGAVLAMSIIVSDVREAKSVSILDSGKRLRITPPVTTSDGYYDRYQSDTAHQIYYYLSDDSGTLGQSGNSLWRAQNNGDSKRVVKSDVESIFFEYDTSRSIRITVRTRTKISGGIKTTELTQRVVYLRNY